MKRIVCGLVVAGVSVLSIAAQQATPPAGREPSWAFPAINQPLPAEEGAKSVPGSTKSYTPAQIDDLMNPPDWFPDEHAPAPALVQKGHGTAMACGACHLMSGEGHPESAGLTGFTAAYLMQQMADFKSGARKDSARMNTIAKDVTDEESKQVAEWFAALKPASWTKVTEADNVPKTIVGQGRMRFLAPAGGTEPIAQPHHHRPAGSGACQESRPEVRLHGLRAGRQHRQGQGAGRVRRSGKTVACGICHGDTMRGLGNVPRLAGLHPIYIARQLYLFKDGTRNGVDAQLMKKPVARLTDDDILAIAAYLGSL